MRLMTLKHSIWSGKTDENLAEPAILLFVFMGLRKLKLIFSGV